MKTIITVIIFALLLITACSSQVVEKTQEPTDLGSVMEKQTEMVPINSVEIRMDDNEFFEPQTIEVEKGEQIRLVFMNEKPYVFSIESLGVVESVSAGSYVDLEVEKAGNYVFECLDCEQANPGLLRVY